jgi:NAD(P)H-flavin reductase
MKEMLCIGTVIEQEPVPKGPLALNPRKWVDLKLVEKREISHDTRYFKFEFPDKSMRIGMPVGNHVLLGAHIGNQFIIRPYTPVHPVSKEEERGCLEFIIKIYFAKQHPFFRKGGVLTQYLEKLKIGDTMKGKGPAGHVNYHGNGVFTVNSTYTFKAKQVSMIAGGSGLTPCYQLARAILKNPEDKTQMSLIYANKTADDILMRNELDEMARNFPNFKVYYTVSTPPDNWKYGVGHVEEKMMKDQLYPPSPLSVVFVCGPPAMVEHALLPNLEKIGYTDVNVIEF